MSLSNMAHGFIFSLQKINKQTALKDARKTNYFKAVNYHPDTLKCVFFVNQIQLLLEREDIAQYRF